MSPNRFPARMKSSCGMRSTGANGRSLTARWPPRAKEQPIASNARQPSQCLIDPKLEGAAPSRVLGRLHDQTPRIPFITGWASNREAVRFLNDSLKARSDQQDHEGLSGRGDGERKFGHRSRRRFRSLKELSDDAQRSELRGRAGAAQDDARALLKKWGA